MFPLTDAVAAFRTHCLARGLASKTIGWYTAHLQVFADFTRRGNCDWTGRDTIEAFFAELRERGQRYPSHPHRNPTAGPLSQATIRAYHRTLRCFFRYLVEVGRLDRNPLEKFRLVRQEKQIPRGITLSDFVRLYAAATTERDRALLLLLLDTGARVSEVCAMRTQDTYPERGLAIVRGKNRQERFIFFSQPTAQALTRWLQVRPNAGEHLFLKMDGHQQISDLPMTPATVAETLKRLAERAKVEGRCNPHSFRHARAREHRFGGGEIDTLMVLLGHQDISTTMVYGMLPSPALREVVLRTSPVLQMVKDGIEV